MKSNNAIAFVLFASVFIAPGWCQVFGDQISVARSIIHKVDWISIGTISTLEQIKGYPFTNLKSVSDGTKYNGTGVPYLLMTDMDLSGADVKENNAVTIMASLAEKNDCYNKKYDPQDPRCGRLLISGRLVKLDPNSQEGIFARKALFERHPVMALWIRDWISIATISTLEQVKGYPFANLKSVSDGTKYNGSGVPYLLMTDLDLSGADVKVNNAVTIMASLAETNDCHLHDYDPQDPRCGRPLISGRLVKLDNTTEEGIFAQNALFERHPVMKEWVKVHDFYFAKIDMEKILLLDHYGGAVDIDVKTYREALPPTDVDNKLTNLENMKKQTNFYLNALLSMMDKMLLHIKKIHKVTNK